ncbi:hypothetical protein Fcan01_19861 [Folsomia candida]|uniref:Uncharacterized protein n=1 Tax=Folsomia candida TaxID=158441 RepID=A0A226DHL0_FOLCA|nr:hypothetical protein Fcan01_19861 [Folsomia candida]
MFAKYFLIAVLLVAGIQAMSMNPEEKLFFANIPIATNQTFNLVPLSCTLFGVLCPFGYTGPRGGVKRVDFQNTCIRQDAFTAYIEGLILHSWGFKSAKIGGGYLDVPKILEVIQPIFEESGAPIRVKGGVIRN